MNSFQTLFYFSTSLDISWLRKDIKFKNIGCRHLNSLDPFFIVFSDAEDNWYCKRFALIIIRIIKVPLSLLLHNRNRTHTSAASYSLKENLLGPFHFAQNVMKILFLSGILIGLSFVSLNTVS